MMEPKPIESPEAKKERIVHILLVVLSVLGIVGTAVPCFIPMTELMVWYLIPPLLSIGLLVLHFVSEWRWLLICCGAPCLLTFGIWFAIVAIISGAYGGFPGIVKAFYESPSLLLYPFMPWITLFWMLQPLVCLLVYGRFK